MSSFYLPFAAEADQERIEEIIRQNSLATLIITSKNESSNLPLISYIPLLFNREENTLRGHIARANPVAHLDLDQTYDCTAIFHGPDAYISASWYESKKETGKAVPTWNYIAVHMIGKCRFIKDSTWIHDNVSELSNYFENMRGSHWKITDAPPAYIQAMIRGVVGIEIAVEQVDGRFKLSQNRSLEDQRAVIENLRKTNQGNDEEIATWIEKVQPNHST